MSPPGKPRRWTAALHRIASGIDSWPGWVMILLAMACLLTAIWLLTRAYDLNLSLQLPPPHLVAAGGARSQSAGSSQSHLLGHTLVLTEVR